MKGILIAIVLSFSLMAGETQERKPLEPTCHAIVTLANNSITVSPLSVRHYDLVRCEDVEFKGGGVVIRHITDAPMGFWSIMYYPSHRVSAVSVTPKFAP